MKNIIVLYITYITFLFFLKKTRIRWDSNYVPKTTAKENTNTVVFPGYPIIILAI